jgi:hypothetical protein
MNGRNRTCLRKGWEEARESLCLNFSREVAAPVCAPEIPPRFQELAAHLEERRKQRWRKSLKTLT